MKKIRLENETKAKAEIERAKVEAAKIETDAKAEAARAETDANKLKLEAEIVKARMEHAFKWHHFQ